MPKIVDFGHPTVELKFKTLDTGTGYALLVQVSDANTGELLFSEALRKTDEWLKAMGYTWLQGSQGVLAPMKNVAIYLLLQRIDHKLDLVMRELKIEAPLVEGCPYCGEPWRETEHVCHALAQTVKL